ncbi:MULTISPECIES: Hsp33 family molecular chaperone HslO [unclassified Oleiphilus]|jgi:molecular chaperone Hsp33|uniref:Hsp33 family molecular chaperone HslO n=1 Tax=unclassified Oleiphilus TaxID=2631174 RepID=UPI0007C268F8|nr:MULTISPECIES: Hsp33 family molecular chaperone HslO [unclassified Oleiphilus]KZY51535.1 molecular chaperone Hsp33 [Oleiphilus sp. HI0050]KZY86644.1 molecular chaperone Hsp33 [Oleiphilus sp. HI0072]KZZ11933.1 molecular chaperone Hsp33 [Oleiphilus sp. HI0078]KZZ22520.1 molecular chaperone Hsp33 [Oleiphilus sp. HI0081]KZY29112.1 molecular chaperone Hsp33 [Oleiphilus sp. HI0043]
MIDQDTFQKFLFEELQIRGEWVRLGESFQQASKNMSYPSEVKALLGETIAASVLLTGTLKFDGRLSIHARGEGALSLLMAETTNLKTFKGVAHWQGDIEEGLPLKDYLGNAQLVITIDPDRGNRYQGIVPLERETLSECLEQYFEMSEQLDTYMLLGADELGCYGLMLQKLPGYREIEDQDAWDRVTQLAKTLSSEELVSTDNETLLVRLFHEEKVITYQSEPVQFKCSCSKERTAASIQSLGKEEALDILEHEAEITVDCQFCAARYTFDRTDVQNLFDLGEPH